ncbi:hypothetical protein C8Q80DRAFT_784015 [Daedaleopsis nitida]|nr:hypothetical protein C8Q80DRAFT_784015 [Daedaleopsis nitida]
MLVSTIIVVWRSRPSARLAARTSRRRTHAPGDLERAPSYCKDKSTYKHQDGDTSVDSAASSPELQTPELPPPSPAMYARSSHSVASTLNVIISPSMPHLVKLGADGALEVRVTPPSPVLRPGADSMRFGGIPSGPPGENDSVWWVI